MLKKSFKEQQKNPKHDHERVTNDDFFYINRLFYKFFEKIFFWSEWKFLFFSISSHIKVFVENKKITKMFKKPQKLYLNFKTTIIFEIPRGVDPLTGSEV